MIKAVSLTLISALLLLGLHANAATFVATADGSQADVTPLILHLAPLMKRLPKSIQVFNWSNVAPNVTQPASAVDPSALAHAKAAADVFWNHYGDRRYDEEEYGLGLYVATDPWVTQQDFGDSDNWRLLEVKVPAGFRFIDLTQSAALAANDVALFSRFGCRFDTVDSIFNASNLSSTCIAAVKSVFVGGLGLQGFSYPYPAAHFSVCGTAHQSAMVIADKSALLSSTVRAFAPETTSDVDGRVVLQSLLYRAADAAGELIPDPNAVRGVFQQYPSAKIYANGSGDAAELIVSLPGQSDLNVTVPYMTADANDYPQQIDSKWLGPGLPHPLLWSDLVGRPTYRDIDIWIKHNLYGCQ